MAALFGDDAVDMAPPTPPSNAFAGVLAESTNALTEILAASVTHVDGKALKRAACDSPHGAPFKKAALEQSPSTPMVEAQSSSAMGACYICKQSDGHWAKTCRIGFAECASKPSARKIPCSHCKTVPQPGDRIVKMKFGKYNTEWLHARCAAEQAVLAGFMPQVTFNQLWR